MNFNELLQELIDNNLSLLKRQKISKTPKLKNQIEGQLVILNQMQSRSTGMYEMTWIEQLCKEVEDNGMIMGTSISKAIGEVTVKGKEYQAQVRIEGSKSDWVEEGQIYYASGDSISI